MERIAADERYFWNLNLYKDFIEQLIDCKWFTPMIQGYCGQQNGIVQGKFLIITLISRRMHKRTGTRYNARGLDERGFVGNQVEKETIILIDGK